MMKVVQGSFLISQTVHCLSAFFPSYRKELSWAEHRAVDKHKLKNVQSIEPPLLWFLFSFLLSFHSLWALFSGGVGWGNPLPGPFTLPLRRLFAVKLVLMFSFFSCFVWCYREHAWGRAVRCIHTDHYTVPALYPIIRTLELVSLGVEVKEVVDLPLFRQ